MLLPQKGKKQVEGNLEVMDIFMALVVVLFSHVCIYLQTHQVVYIKYLQLSVCQAYLNKALFKKKKRKKERKWTALEPCGECGPVNTFTLESDLHEVTESISIISAPQLS